MRHALLVELHFLTIGTTGHELAPVDIGRRGRKSCQDGIDNDGDGLVDDGLDACTYFRVHMVGGRKMHKKFAPLPKVQSHEEKWRKSYWEAHAG